MLAASEQRRRDADKARLERVARVPLQVPCPVSAFQPFSRRIASRISPPWSRSEARPFSARLPARTRALARAPQSVGCRGYVEVWRTDDDVQLAVTVRVIAPQRLVRRAGSWPQRPALHAHLMARRFWRTRDKSCPGGGPAPQYMRDSLSTHGFEPGAAQVGSLEPDSRSARVTRRRRP